MRPAPSGAEEPGRRSAARSRCREIGPRDAPRNPASVVAVEPSRSGVIIGTTKDPTSTVVTRDRIDGDLGKIAKSGVGLSRRSQRAEDRGQNGKKPGASVSRSAWLLLSSVL